MSDFTAFYSLKTTDQAEAVELLKRANRKGYVFPQTGKWVSFVADANEFKADPKVTSFNEGILLHYTRTDDFFGWGFSIFNGPQCVCQFDIADFGEGIRIKDKDFNSESLELIVDSDKVDRIKEILYPESTEEAYKIKPDYVFAELVGLHPVEWISWGIVDQHLEDYVDQYGEVITVA
jgi:hypothetical protein